jgi:hypothetical protein
MVRAIADGVQRHLEALLHPPRELLRELPLLLEQEPRSAPPVGVGLEERRPPRAERAIDEELHPAQVHPSAKHGPVGEHRIGLGIVLPLQRVDPDWQCACRFETEQALPAVGVDACVVDGRQSGAGAAAGGEEHLRVQLRRRHRRHQRGDQLHRSIDQEAAGRSIGTALDATANGISSVATDAGPGEDGRADPDRVAVHALEDDQVTAGRELQVAGIR